MRWALILAALAGSSAAADTTYTIAVSNRVTEVQPSATVEVRAVFEKDVFAFAGAEFDFAAAPDAGGFSNPHDFLDGPANLDGDVAPDGDSVAGIISSQSRGCRGDCPPDQSDPILIWTVVWSTNDFTARSVPLATVTAQFDVYTDGNGSSRSAMDDLVEGSGLIEVGCYADCTNDGMLDLFDFLCFVNQLNAGAHDADCDGSGGLDLFDFLCFVNAFNGGC